MSVSQSTSSYLVSSSSTFCVYSSKWRARFGDVICTVAEFLRGTDTVAKLPRLPHETRRLSRDHNDGAKAAWDANDAIDAIVATTSRSSSFLASESLTSRRLSSNPPLALMKR